MNVRESVYRSLIRIEKEKRYSSLELDSVISETALQSDDKAFFTALFYGVIERKITLDYIISLYSSKAVSRLDLSTLVILRIGLYQLFFLDRVPSSAAVNESVKLAARYSSRSKGFINALLRRASLESEIPLPDKEADHIKYLSVKYSIPRELCELWQRDYPIYGEELYEFANSSPFITLRVNTIKGSPEKVCEKLPVKAEKCSFAPYGVRLTSHIPVSELSFEDGLYYVQDEASQIAVHALGAKKGETVVDVCACPGGKTFGAAMYMENIGKIYSFDVHKSKLSLVSEGARRLGIDIIDIAEHDSTLPLPELFGKADRLICDVPCSGLGVIAKKSDLRYKELDDIKELPELQYKILCSSVACLKDGGTVVYSTCTLRKAENEDVVNRFLYEHPDFSLVPFDAGELHSDGMLTLFPHIHGTDGFFIAKMIKKDINYSKNGS